MAFIILQIITDRYKWESNALLFIDKRSMTIYLFHQQVIYYFIILLNGMINPYLHMLIMFVGGFTVSLFVANVLMKFIAK